MTAWWPSIVSPVTIAGLTTSGLEIAVVLTGITAVALTARGFVAGLLIGVINVVLAAALYYDARLYSDLALQFYYLVSNIMGFFWWRQHNAAGVVYVRTLNRASYLNVVGAITLLTGAAAFVTGRLHIWLPQYFLQPAALAVADAAILGLSITAQWLMVRRFIENWYIWLAVNVLAVVVYTQRGLFILAGLFFLYGILAYIGVRRWRKLPVS